MTDPKAEMDMAAHPSDANICVEPLPFIDSSGEPVECLDDNFLRDVAPHQHYKVFDIVSTMFGRVLLPRYDANTMHNVAQAVVEYRQANPNCRIILSIDQGRCRLLIGNRATVERVVECWASGRIKPKAHAAMLPSPH